MAVDKSAPLDPNQVSARTADETTDSKGKRNGVAGARAHNDTRAKGKKGTAPSSTTDTTSSKNTTKPNTKPRAGGITSDGTPQWLEPPKSTAKKPPAPANKNNQATEIKNAAVKNNAAANDITTEIVGVLRPHRDRLNDHDLGMVIDYLSNDTTRIPSVGAELKNSKDLNYTFLPSVRIALEQDKLLARIPLTERAAIKKEIAEIKAEANRRGGINSLASVDFKIWLGQDGSRYQQTYDDYFNRYIDRYIDKSKTFHVETRQLTAREECEDWLQTRFNPKNTEPEEIVAELTGKSPDDQRFLLNHILLRFFETDSHKINKLADYIQKNKSNIDENLRLFIAHFNPDSKEIIAELKGKSPGDQRALLDAILLRFSESHFDKIDALADYVQNNKSNIDENMRLAIGERFLQRAITLANNSPPNLAQAQAFALDFSRAMRKDLSNMGLLLSKLNDKKEIFSFASLFDPELQIPKASVLRHVLFDAGMLSGAHNQILAALNKVQITETNSATITSFVFLIHDLISPEDINKTPKLARNLALAQARAHYPADPAKAEAEATRLEGVLEEWNGAALLCGRLTKWLALGAFWAEPRFDASQIVQGGIEPLTAPAISYALTNPVIARSMADKLITELSLEKDSKIPNSPELVARLAAILQNIRVTSKAIFNPNISDGDRRMFLLAVCSGKFTADDFNDDFWHRDPWRVVAKSIGEMYAAEYHDLAAPVPVAIPGMLKNIIGRAGQRNITNSNKEITEKDILALPEALKTGEMPGVFSTDFYLGDETVEKIYKQIDRLHYPPGEPPVFAYKYYHCFASEFGIEHHVIYLVRDGFDRDDNATYACIDENGEVWTNEKEWREKKLAGTMAYHDESGTFVAEMSKAEASTGKKILHGAAKTGIQMGMAATIAGTDGVAALVFEGLGIVGGGIETGPSLAHLWELYKHNGLGALATQEAAYEWLNVVVNTAGAPGFGGKTAALGLEKLAVRQAGRGLQAANRTLAVAKSAGAISRRAASVAAVGGFIQLSAGAKSLYDEYQRFKEESPLLTPEERRKRAAELSKQLVDFGTNVYLFARDAKNARNHSSGPEFATARVVNGDAGKDPRPAGKNESLAPGTIVVPLSNKPSPNNASPPADQNKDKDNIVEPAEPEIQIRDAGPPKPTIHDIHWTGRAKDFIENLIYNLHKFYPEKASAIESELAEWAKAYAQKNGKPPSLSDTILETINIAERNGARPEPLGIPYEIQGLKRKIDQVNNKLKSVNEQLGKPQTEAKLRELYEEGKALTKKREALLNQIEAIFKQHTWDPTSPLPQETKQKIKALKEELEKEKIQIPYEIQRRINAFELAAGDVEYQLGKLKKQLKEYPEKWLKEHPEKRTEILQEGYKLLEKRDSYLGEIVPLLEYPLQALKAQRARQQYEPLPRTPAQQPVPVAAAANAVPLAPTAPIITSGGAGAITSGGSPSPQGGSAQPIGPIVSAGAGGVVTNGIGAGGIDPNANNAARMSTIGSSGGPPSTGPTTSTGGPTTSTGYVTPAGSGGATSPATPATGPAAGGGSVSTGATSTGAANGGGQPDTAPGSVPSAALSVQGTGPNAAPAPAPAPAPGTGPASTSQETPAAASPTAGQSGPTPAIETPAKTAPEATADREQTKATEAPTTSADKAPAAAEHPTGRPLSRQRIVENQRIIEDQINKLYEWANDIESRYPNLDKKDIYTGLPTEESNPDTIKLLQKIRGLLDNPRITAKQCQDLVADLFNQPTEAATQTFMRQTLRQIEQIRAEESVPGIAEINDKLSALEKEREQTEMKAQKLGFHPLNSESSEFAAQDEKSRTLHAEAEGLRDRYEALKQERDKLLKAHRPDTDDLFAAIDRVNTPHELYSKYKYNEEQLHDLLQLCHDALNLDLVPSSRRYLKDRMQLVARALANKKAHIVGGPWFPGREDLINVTYGKLRDKFPNTSEADFSNAFANLENELWQWDKSSHTVQDNNSNTVQNKNYHTEQELSDKLAGLAADFAKRLPPSTTPIDHVTKPAAPGAVHGENAPSGAHTPRGTGSHAAILDPKAAAASPTPPAAAKHSADPTHAPEAGDLRASHAEWDAFGKSLESDPSKPHVTITSIPPEPVAPSSTPAPQPKPSKQTGHNPDSKYWKLAPEATRPPEQSAKETVPLAVRISNDPKITEAVTSVYNYLTRIGQSILAEEFKNDFWKWAHKRLQSREPLTQDEVVSQIENFTQKYEVLRGDPHRTLSDSITPRPDIPPEPLPLTPATAQAGAGGTVQKAWANKSENLIEAARYILRENPTLKKQIETELETWADKENPTAEQVAQEIVKLAGRHNLDDITKRNLGKALNEALRSQPPSPEPPPAPTPSGGRPAPDTSLLSSGATSPTSSSPDQGGKPKARAQDQESGVNFGRPAVNENERVNFKRPAVNNNNPKETPQNKIALAAGAENNATFDPNNGTTVAKDTVSSDPGPGGIDQAKTGTFNPGALGARASNGNAGDGKNGGGGGDGSVNGGNGGPTVLPSGGNAGSSGNSGANNGSVGRRRSPGDTVIGTGSTDRPTQPTTPDVTPVTAAKPSDGEDSLQKLKENLEGVAAAAQAAVDKAHQALTQPQTTADTGDAKTLAGAPAGLVTRPPAPPAATSSAALPPRPPESHAGPPSEQPLSSPQHTETETNGPLTAKPESLPTTKLALEKLKAVLAKNKTSDASQTPTSGPTGPQPAPPSNPPQTTVDVSGAKGLDVSLTGQAATPPAVPSTTPPVSAPVPDPLVRPPEIHGGPPAPQGPLSPPQIEASDPAAARPTDPLSAALEGLKHFNEEALRKLEASRTEPSTAEPELATKSKEPAQAETLPTAQHTRTNDGLLNEFKTAVEQLENPKVEDKLAALDKIIGARLKLVSESLSESDRQLYKELLGQFRRYITRYITESRKSQQLQDAIDAVSPPATDPPKSILSKLRRFTSDLAGMPKEIEPAGSHEKMAQTGRLDAKNRRDAILKIESAFGDAETAIASLESTSNAVAATERNTLREQADLKVEELRRTFDDLKSHLSGDNIKNYTETLKLLEARIASLTPPPPDGGGGSGGGDGNGSGGGSSGGPGSAPPTNPGGAPARGEPPTSAKPHEVKPTASSTGAGTTTHSDQVLHVTSKYAETIRAINSLKELAGQLKGAAALNPEQRNALKGTWKNTLEAAEAKKNEFKSELFKLSQMNDLTKDALSIITHYEKEFGKRTLQIAKLNERVAARAANQNSSYNKPEPVNLSYEEIEYIVRDLNTVLKNATIKSKLLKWAENIPPQSTVTVGDLLKAVHDNAIGIVGNIKAALIEKEFSEEIEDYGYIDHSDNISSEHLKKWLSPELDPTSDGSGPGRSGGPTTSTPTPAAAPEKTSANSGSASLLKSELTNNTATTAVKPVPIAVNGNPWVGVSKHAVPVEPAGQASQAASPGQPPANTRISASASPPKGPNDPGGPTGPTGPKGPTDQTGISETSPVNGNSRVEAEPKPAAPEQTGMRNLSQSEKTEIARITRRINELKKMLIPDILDHRDRIGLTNDLPRLANSYLDDLEAMRDLNPTAQEMVNQCRQNILNLVAQANAHGIEVELRPAEHETAQAEDSEINQHTEPSAHPENPNEIVTLAQNLEPILKDDRLKSALLKWLSKVPPENTVTVGELVDNTIKNLEVSNIEAAKLKRDINNSILNVYPKNKTISAKDLLAHLLSEPNPDPTPGTRGPGGSGGPETTPESKPPTTAPDDANKQQNTQPVNVAAGAEGYTLRPHANPTTVPGNASSPADGKLTGGVLGMHGSGGTPGGGAGGPDDPNKPSGPTGPTGPQTGTGTGSTTGTGTSGAGQSGGSTSSGRTGGGIGGAPTPADKPSASTPTGKSTETADKPTPTRPSIRSVPVVMAEIGDANTAANKTVYNLKRAISRYKLAKGITANSLETFKGSLDKKQLASLDYYLKAARDAVAELKTKLGELSNRPAFSKNTTALEEKYKTNQKELETEISDEQILKKLKARQSEIDTLNDDSGGPTSEDTATSASDPTLSTSNSSSNADDAARPSEPSSKELPELKVVDGGVKAEPVAPLRKLTEVERLQIESAEQFAGNLEAILGELNKGAFDSEGDWLNAMAEVRKTYTILFEKYSELAKIKESLATGPEKNRIVKIGTTVDWLNERLNELEGVPSQQSETTKAKPGPRPVTDDANGANEAQNRAEAKETTRQPGLSEPYELHEIKGLEKDTASLEELMNKLEDGFLFDGDGAEEQRETIRKNARSDYDKLSERYSKLAEKRESLTGDQKSRVDKIGPRLNELKTRLNLNEPANTKPKLTVVPVPDASATPKPSPDGQASAPKKLELKVVPAEPQEGQQTTGEGKTAAKEAKSAATEPSGTHNLSDMEVAAFDSLADEIDTLVRNLKQKPSADNVKELVAWRKAGVEVAERIRSFVIKLGRINKENLSVQEQEIIAAYEARLKDANRRFISGWTEQKPTASEQSGRHNLSRSEINQIDAIKRKAAEITKRLEEPTPLPGNEKGITRQADDRFTAQKAYENLVKEFSQISRKRLSPDDIRMLDECGALLQAANEKLNQQQSGPADSGASTAAATPPKLTLVTEEPSTADKPAVKPEIVPDNRSPTEPHGNDNPTQPEGTAGGPLLARPARPIELTGDETTGLAQTFNSVLDKYPKVKSEFIMRLPAEGTVAIGEVLEVLKTVIDKQKSVLGSSATMKLNSLFGTIRTDHGFGDTNTVVAQTLIDRMLPPDPTPGGPGRGGSSGGGGGRGGPAPGGSSPPPAPAGGGGRPAAAQGGLGATAAGSANAASPAPTREPSLSVLQGGGEDRPKDASKANKGDPDPTAQGQQLARAVGDHDWHDLRQGITDRTLPSAQQPQTPSSRQPITMTGGEGAGDGNRGGGDPKLGDPTTSIAGGGSGSTISTSTGSDRPSNSGKGGSTFPKGGSSQLADSGNASPSGSDAQPSTTASGKNDSASEPGGPNWGLAKELTPQAAEDIGKKLAAGRKDADERIKLEDAEIKSGLVGWLSEQKGFVTINDVLKTVRSKAKDVLTKEAEDILKNNTVRENVRPEDITEKEKIKIKIEKEKEIKSKTEEIVQDFGKLVYGNPDEPYNFDAPISAEILLGKLRPKKTDGPGPGGSSPTPPKGETLPKSDGDGTAAAQEEKGQTKNRDSVQNSPQPNDFSRLDIIQFDKAVQNLQQALDRMEVDLNASLSGGLFARTPLSEVSEALQKLKSLLDRYNKNGLISKAQGQIGHYLSQYETLNTRFEVLKKQIKALKKQPSPAAPGGRTSTSHEINADATLAPVNPEDVDASPTQSPVPDSPLVGEPATAQGPKPSNLDGNSIAVAAPAETGRPPARQPSIYLLARQLSDAARWGFEAAKKLPENGPLTSDQRQALNKVRKRISTIKDKLSELSNPENIFPYQEAINVFDLIKKYSDIVIELENKIHIKPTEPDLRGTSNDSLFKSHDKLAAKPSNGDGSAAVSDKDSFHKYSEPHLTGRDDSLIRSIKRLVAGSNSKKPLSIQKSAELHAIYKELLTRSIKELGELNTLDDNAKTLHKRRTANRLALLTDAIAKRRLTDEGLIKEVKQVNRWFKSGDKYKVQPTSTYNLYKYEHTVLQTIAGQTKTAIDDWQSALLKAQKRDCLKNATISIDEFEKALSKFSELKLSDESAKIIAEYIAQLEAWKKLLPSDPGPKDGSGGKGPKGGGSLGGAGAPPSGPGGTPSGGGSGGVSGAPGGSSKLSGSTSGGKPSFRGGTKTTAVAAQPPTSIEMPLIAGSNDVKNDNVKAQHVEAQPLAMVGGLAPGDFVSRHEVSSATNGASKPGSVRLVMGPKEPGNRRPNRVGETSAIQKSNARSSGQSSGSPKKSPPIKEAKLAKSATMSRVPLDGFTRALLDDSANKAEKAVEELRNNRGEKALSKAREAYDIFCNNISKLSHEALSPIAKNEVAKYILKLEILSDDLRILDPQRSDGRSIRPPIEAAANSSNGGGGDDPPGSPPAPPPGSPPSAPPAPPANGGGGEPPAGGNGGSDDNGGKGGDGGRSAGTTPAVSSTSDGKPAEPASGSDEPSKAATASNRYKEAWNETAVDPNELSDQDLDFDVTLLWETPELVSTQEVVNEETVLVSRTENALARLDALGKQEKLSSADLKEREELLRTLHSRHKLLSKEIANRPSNSEGPLDKAFVDHLAERLKNYSEQGTQREPTSPSSDPVTRPEHDDDAVPYLVDPDDTKPYRTETGGTSSTATHPIATAQEYQQELCNRLARGERLSPKEFAVLKSTSEIKLAMEKLNTKINQLLDRGQQLESLKTQRKLTTGESAELNRVVTDAARMITNRAKNNLSLSIINSKNLVFALAKNANELAKQSNELPFPANDKVRKIKDEYKKIRENTNDVIRALESAQITMEKVERYLSDGHNTSEDLLKAATFVTDIRELQSALVKEETDNVASLSPRGLHEVLKEYQDEFLKTASYLNNDNTSLLADRLNEHAAKLRVYAMLRGWSDPNGWCGMMSPDKVVANMIAEVGSKKLYWEIDHPSGIKLEGQLAHETFLNGLKRLKQALTNERN